MRGVDVAAQLHFVRLVLRNLDLLLVGSIAVYIVVLKPGKPLSF